MQIVRIGQIRRAREQRLLVPELLADCSQVQTYMFDKPVDCLRYIGRVLFIMTYTIDDKVDAPQKSGVLYARLATEPPTIKSSKGTYLITDDGRKILDASCGAAVACLGHNDSRVKEAIIRQLDDVAYCYAPFFTTAPAEELAKRLCASTGWQMSRVFIVSSGT